MILPHNIPNERHSYILYPTYGYQTYIDLFKQNKILNNLQLIFNEEKNRLNIINQKHFFKNKKIIDENLKNIDLSKIDKEPINISSNNDLEDNNENSNEENNETSNENTNENNEKDDNEINSNKRVRSNTVRRRGKIRKRKFIKQLIIQVGKL